MQLVPSIILLLASNDITQAFVPHSNSIAQHHGQHTPLVQLRATETEAEKLLRKAAELRKQVQDEEHEVHSTLLQRKKTRDAATDANIAQLFPGDSDDDGVCALCARLRDKRLATDMLERIVERLHEREVAARGLEHVEPSMHHDQVSFKRVAQPNEAELSKIQGLVDRLIEAAEVLDKEFIEQKSKCDGKITHSDIMHWGGGNTATILKDKAKDLGREHDEQFRKRLESFYDAAKRKHSYDDVDKDSWRDDDIWSP